MDDFFLIGIVRAVAKGKGYVSVEPFSDFIERYKELNVVFINVFGDFRKFFVEDSIIKEKSILLKFKNFDSREDVEFLVGKELYILSEDSVSTDENTFFIHDLIGCKIYRNQSFFGILKDVMVLKSNDVLVIDKNGEELLIPFINDYVDEVNIEERKIFLNEAREDFYEDED